MTIRLDPVLRQKLEIRAKKYRRSVGAELQYLAEVGLKSEEEPMDVQSHDHTSFMNLAQHAGFQA